MQIDRISELPDPILLYIISLLPLLEAVSTSILSTRWRHLFMYTDITRLDFQPLRPPITTISLKPPKRTIALKPPELRKFDGSKPRKLDSTSAIKTPQELQKEFSMRPDWISHFLDSYTNAVSGVSLKEFRVKMPFAKRVDVDKWLEFALSTKVEILFIHLERYMYEGSHNFPVENLILKMSNGCPCLTTLKTLDLRNVALNVKELELLISNCDVLERLSIARCKMPGTLVISGLKLKYLYIHGCSAFVRVYNAVNLVSFTCEWQKDLMEVNNVPMLTHIDTDVSFPNTYVELLPALSCCIHQLVKLSLLINPCEMQKYGFRHALPKLINLKHLVLRMGMNYGWCLLPLTPLIEASPSLQKLEMKFLWHTPIFSNVPKVDRDIWEHSHYNLKNVKFSGYLGSPDELEFASYVFKNAVELEEFEVEPCDRICIPFQEIEDTDVQRKASAVAEQQFQPITPKSVKLVIH